MLRTMFFFAVIMFILTGCSKPEKVEQKVINFEADRAENLAFENGSGNVTVIYDKQRDLLHIAVLANELNTQEVYGISLWFDEHGIHNFGPDISTIEVRLGNYVDGKFQPSSKGEMYVLMYSSAAEALKANELRLRIEDGNSKEIMRTAPFALKKK
ncbi:hypothetical protein [Ammoniphilus sp. 3BR4]|uniref:hypothetical protein n=1 Tax=Ammoniphilus sp. 3BR4 TaxID=3158265 RepID=UPI003466D141